MSNEIEILWKENEDMQSLLKEAETQLIVESERSIGALKSAKETLQLQEAKLLVLSKEGHLKTLNESILVLRKETTKHHMVRKIKKRCGENLT